MPLLTPAQTFARIEKAHAAWTRGGATIAVSSATARGSALARFRLDVDGVGGATLRVQNPAHGTYAATDQAFSLRGADLMGVDYEAGETLRRPAPARGALNLRLLAVVGGFDDAVGFLLSADVRRRYLAPMEALTGWQATASGLVRRTTLAGKASLTRLDLDASGKLRALHVELPDSRLDWTFVYGAARPFVVPKGFRRVDAFTARPRPPQFADVKARKVVEGMLRSGGRLQNAIVRLDGAATLWIGGSSVRYERGGSGFAFDGSTLTVRTPGVAYRGRSSRGAIIDQIASLLGDVDPLVRDVLVRTPPYGELFSPEARVRVVGSMASGGKPCDVLEIDGPQYRASVFVGQRDHLPVSVEAGAVDRRGNELAATRRTLDWSSVGAPLPRSLFVLHLRPGQTILPLPKRSRSTGP